MRSIWKGYIRFSLVTIPIRIYNAVNTDETIRFNQLHKEDNGAVGYEKKCKKCGKTLTSEEICKGYQFEPEQYVIVSPEDLDKIKLQSTKAIEIEGFIDSSEIQPSLYESPYFAGPDGLVASKAYALLSEALKASGKVGIGKVV
ncbi:MAG TPA: Ku protein, partial [Verrucomicrobiae bacterium]|nr:Ku protein [Verrucomicrobiae bacterium]